MIGWRCKCGDLRKLKTQYHPNTGKPYQRCTNSGCTHREGYAEAGNP